MPSADFSAQSLHTLLYEALPQCGRKVGQISPGKSMILPCTTAAFTISHFIQTGFVMLCSLTQGFGLICDFCFLRLRSGQAKARSFVLGFLQTTPHGVALAIN